MIYHWDEYHFVLHDVLKRYRWKFNLLNKSWNHFECFMMMISIRASIMKETVNSLGYILTERFYHHFRSKLYLFHDSEKDRGTNSMRIQSFDIFSPTGCWEFQNISLSMSPCFRWNFRFQFSCIQLRDRKFQTKLNIFPWGCFLFYTFVHDCYKKSREKVYLN